MVTAEQIRAARALLRMEQDELARKAGISVTTIRRLEAPHGEEAVAQNTAAEVQMALQEAGVEFIFDGVRLKRAPGGDALYQKLYGIAEESAAMLGDNAIVSESDLYGDDGLPA
jgi:transcriptional regulator with XRE-family HTH domain